VSAGEESLRPYLRDARATPEAVALEPTPFPQTTAEEPLESLYPDWQRRLTRNLARRSDGRWEPLTRTHR
jgi:hypothetical protein